MDEGIICQHNRPSIPDEELFSETTNRCTILYLVNIAFLWFCNLSLYVQVSFSFRCLTASGHLYMFIGFVNIYPDIKFSHTVESSRRRDVFLHNGF